MMYMYVNKRIELTQWGIALQKIYLLLLLLLLLLYVVQYKFYPASYNHRRQITLLTLYTSYFYPIPPTTSSRNFAYDQDHAIPVTTSSLPVL